MENGIVKLDETRIEQFSPDKVELLKRTICKGATNDELELFIHACKRTGLDPFMKQIHAVKRYQDGREVMTIQTGIDGYRLIAERTDRYMPGREPSYEYNTKNELVKSTAYVQKLDKLGKWHEVGASAFWDEYVGKKKGGETNHMWATKPHIMLAKCAEALALRRAFPAELSGVYTAEEMSQADQVVSIETPSAKPAETANPLADDDKFFEATNAAFQEAGFDVPQADACINAVTSKKNVLTMYDLSIADRAKFINAIASGKLDTFKTAPVAQ